MPPRGALRSQVAVLGAYNSYNGFIPPSWANGNHSSEKLRMEIPLESDSELEYCGSDFENQFNFGICSGVKEAGVRETSVNGNR